MLNLHIFQHFNKQHTTWLSNTDRLGAETPLENSFATLVITGTLECEWSPSFPSMYTEFIAFKIFAAREIVSV